MSIYNPYVYIVTSRVDQSYYIGMRSAHKTIPENDLGKYYFTSNKEVKEDFDNFKLEIIAMFFSWEDAFIYENELIKENWGDPLLLNKHYQINPSTFSMKGFKRPDLSEINRKQKTKPKEIRIFECRECGSNIEKLEFVHHVPKEYYYCNSKCRNIFTGRHRTVGTETRKKISESLKGKELSIETRQRISQSNKGNDPWNKGKICQQISDACKGQEAWNRGKENPTAANNGKKSAKKQSATVTGRRKVVRNGKSTWAYPSDPDYPKCSISVSKNERSQKNHAATA